MNENLYLQLLDIACGAILLCAVLTLWRRELSVIIKVFALQGIALAGLAVILAVNEHHAELGILAVVILVLRAGLLPWLLSRVRIHDGALRETRPIMNVSASLLAAAALTLLSYAVSTPLTRLVNTPSTHAVPVALAVVLIGFFVLVTRRRAVSQIVGFLLIDNGITAVGFLTTASVPLMVELGISLDVLFAVLVLRVLTSRLRDVAGQAVDVAELRELQG